MTIKVNQNIEAFEVRIGINGVPGNPFPVPPGDYEAKIRKENYVGEQRERKEEGDIIQINIFGIKVWRSRNGWITDGAQIIS